ncbi:MAG: dockerin type I repeat-containing protein [Christensenellales bacterium]
MKKKMRRNHVVVGILVLIALLAFFCILHINATAEMQELKCEITLNKTTVQVGQSIKADWTITGGTAPYELSYALWYLSDAYEGYAIIDACVIDNSCSFTPEHGTSGYLYIIVSDFEGHSVSVKSSTFSIIGAPVDPFILAVTLDKESVTIGETITGRWSAKGGTSPYLYRYWFQAREANGDFVDEAGNDIDVTEYSFTPLFGSSGTLIVEVVDSFGRHILSERQFSITGSLPVQKLKLTVWLDKENVSYGETITAHWSAIGGTEPYYFFPDWGIKQKDTDEYAIIQWQCGTKNTQDEFSPINGAIGRFRVSVQDSLGRIMLTENDSPDNELFFSIIPGQSNAISGDANHDGTVDILDLVSIIDYIVSGTNPASLANADANGDGTVDILDLVWIIDQIVER